MVNFREAVTKKAKEVACWVADNGDRQDDIWAEATEDNPFVGIGQGSALFSPYPLARLICGDADTDPPVEFTPEVPFTGGQCPTFYNVKIETQYYFDSDPDDVRTVNSSIGGTATNRLKGPIVGIETTPGNNNSILYQLRGATFNGEDRAVTYFTKFSNQVVISSAITLVTRLDGEADDCGDPTAAGPPVLPDEVCYDLPDGTEVCDPVKIQPRTPKTGPTGDIIIPFDFDFGTGPIDIGFNLGDGSITFGGGNPTASDPCCTPAAPNNDPPPETPDDPPPPEDERRFVGLIVTATEISPTVNATEVVGGNELSLFIPRISTVSIAIEVGGSRSWTVDFAVKKRKQFFPVPEYALGYSWAIYDEPGVTTVVTPLYVEDSEE